VGRPEAPGRLSPSLRRREVNPFTMHLLLRFLSLGYAGKVVALVSRLVIANVASLERTHRSHVSHSSD
jgi:hypothetical protein